MKFNPKDQKMNLPQYIKFGLEIEAQNCNFKEIEKILQEDESLKKWKIELDQSVTDNGVEIVSPPLNENENPNLYVELEKVLDILKSNPADKTRKVYVNEQCGGHIHFDATMMKKNPEMMESFLRLWKESEVLMYKMCNAKDNVIRNGAVKLTPVQGIKRMLFSMHSEIAKAVDVAEKENVSVSSKIPQALKSGAKKTINGVLNISGSILNPNGYAHPIGKKLDDAGKNDKYIKKVFKSADGNKFVFDRKLKVLTKHETGINMQHLTKKSMINKSEDFLKKRKELNTYEFRMHNSSLDVNTWKQNIMLDSAFSKIAYEMAYEPGKNDKKLSEFFNKNITEDLKVDKFLKLLFENEDDRKIYKERWESVKDNAIYKNIKGFDKSCFKKEDVKKIALKSRCMDISNYMKNFFYKTKEFLKSERSGVQTEKIVMDYGGRDNERDL